MKNSPKYQFYLTNLYPVLTCKLEKQKVQDGNRDRS